MRNQQPATFCQNSLRNSSNFYCQGLLTRQQRAYRHLLVEYAVLQAGGEAWRRAVRMLKQQGLKTEPAFA